MRCVLHKKKDGNGVVQLFSKFGSYFLLDLFLKRVGFFYFCFFKCFVGRKEQDRPWLLINVVMPGFVLGCVFFVFFNKNKIHEGVYFLFSFLFLIIGNLGLIERCVQLIL